MLNIPNFESPASLCYDCFTKQYRQVILSLSTTYHLEVKKKIYTVHATSSVPKIDSLTTAKQH